MMWNLTDKNPPVKMDSEHTHRIFEQKKKKKNHALKTGGNRRPIWKNLASRTDSEHTLYPSPGVSVKFDRTLTIRKRCRNRCSRITFVSVDAVIYDASLQVPIGTSKSFITPRNNNRNG